MGTLSRDTSLAGLAPGPHTVHIRELRDGIWTDWSAPFTFTIRAPITLTILALCNWTDRSTLATCRAGAAEGLDPEAGWYIWASGFEDWGNVYLSVNGGSPPLASGNFTLRGLPPGRYTLQMNERRATGWVGWSVPYTFTIRASDTQIVVDWLWQLYDNAVAFYDEYSAIERNTPGVYTYRRAGQLHGSLSVQAQAWGDDLWALTDSLDGFRVGVSCDLARQWIALSARELSLMSGWFELIYRSWPYVDYFDEVEESTDNYFAARQESLDAIERCDRGQ